MILKLIFNVSLKLSIPLDTKITIVDCDIIINDNKIDFGP